MGVIIWIEEREEGKEKKKIWQSSYSTQSQFCRDILAALCTIHKVASKEERELKDLEEAEAMYPLLRGIIQERRQKLQLEAACYEEDDKYSMLQHAMKGSDFEAFEFFTDQFGKSEGRLSPTDAGKMATFLNFPGLLPLLRRQYPRVDQLYDGLLESHRTQKNAIISEL